MCTSSLKPRETQPLCCSSRVCARSRTVGFCWSPSLTAARCGALACPAQKPSSRANPTVSTASFYVFIHSYAVKRKQISLAVEMALCKYCGYTVPSISYLCSNKCVSKMTALLYGMKNESHGFLLHYVHYGNVTSDTHNGLT